MSRIEQNMIAENIADITSGIHGLAERLAYRYAAIERRHRFRFLFDPLRRPEQTDFIQRYLAGGGRTSAIVPDGQWQSNEVDPLRTRVASLDNQMVLLNGAGLILSFALLEILV